MKKLTGIFIFLSLSAVFVLSSCDHLHRIDGNHMLTSQTRQLESFTEVDLSSDFRVYVHQDTFSNVVIEAEENLMPYIKTTVSGNRLHIGVKNNSRIDPNISIRVDVFTPTLTALNLSGSGSMETDTFNVSSFFADISGSGYISFKTHTQNLDADISGSGEMDMAGSADEMHLKISGSGDMRALDLLAASCYAKISGSGSMYVNASDYLNVDISGSGDVYYLGQPQLNINISGSGQLIHY